MWDVSGSGGYWNVQLEVRDLGGHLDFTLRARAVTLSSRVREATFGVASVGEFKLKIAEAVTFVITAAAFSAPLGTRVLLTRQPQQRHHVWTWRRARKEQLRVSTWLRLLRSPLTAWFKSAPISFLTRALKEREERKIKEIRGVIVLLVRGLLGNTMVVHCGSGWTARDLSDSLRVRTSVPVHLFYLVVEGRVMSW